MEYSLLGSGKLVSQTFNDGCLKTTFERENGLKSEYEIYVNWTNPDQLAERCPDRTKPVVCMDA